MLENGHQSTASNSKFLSLDNIKRNQTSILVPIKEPTQKKIKELMKIKEEPNSCLNSAATQALISKTYLQKTTNILHRRAKAQELERGVEPPPYQRPKRANKQQYKLSIKQVPQSEQQYSRDSRDTSKQEEEEESVKAITYGDEDEVNPEEESVPINGSPDDQSTIFGLGPLAHAALKDKQKFDRAQKKKSPRKATNKRKTRSYISEVKVEEEDDEYPIAGDNESIITDQTSLQEQETYMNQDQVSESANLQNMGANTSVNSFMSIINNNSSPEQQEAQRQNLEDFRTFLQIKKQNVERLPLSFRFSKIDYQKQCQTIQELKAMNPNRKNYGDPSQCGIDLQVYSMAYKAKLRSDSRHLQIVLPLIPTAIDEDAPRKVIKQKIQRLELVKQQLSSYLDPYEFIGDDNMMPQLPRLLYLHQKYCAGQSQKTIEDLQKDLFCVNDDLRNLELYLKGEKVAYWTTIEDYVLKKHAFEVLSPEYQFLIKQKGPEEVQKRREFLGV
ncbi:hypothetical protein FGO68_gene16776 [Halteria grandinella]|uniref:Uncharacterized protein n=1 Tax=Halteria grandinella TaxID=5974 RepID=A0A8J8T5Z5_HALGN|nr:hypothetical protein FGO68_gene16776 [Halteria grandinella]